MLPELEISVASLVSQQESYLELLLSTPKYSIEISSLISFYRHQKLIKFADRRIAQLVANSK